jgi:hypothetical protein
MTPEYDLIPSATLPNNVCLVSCGRVTRCWLRDAWYTFDEPKLKLWV